jgi:V8-like Glu-specific endopeptidase
MRRTILALVFCLLVQVPAAAMVGGASPAGATGRSIIMLVSSRGSACSGVALARSLVLTAAHCVLPGADYKIAEYDDARNLTLKDIATIKRHPDFDATAALRGRASADVALLKIGAVLRNQPAAIAPGGSTVAVGDRLVVAGYGLAAPGDGKTGGTARSAELVVTGQPGTLQIRLMDPATRGERAGLGACTGDSGAPVFRDRDGQLLVIGVVSWSTGPKLSEGCGGLTGVTPLTRYRAWIVDTAKALGSPLNP